MAPRKDAPADEPVEKNPDPANPGDDSLSPDDPPRESGEEQVDEAIQREQGQGFHGTEVDPTPNENYTLQGVTSNAPTPENDDDAAREARARLEQNRVR